MIRIPDWLTDNAKRFWKIHVDLVDLNATNKETFAVLCQAYGDWRETLGSNDPFTLRRQKSLYDLYLKYACQFGLTPKTASKEPEKKANALESFLTETD